MNALIRYNSPLTSMSNWIDDFLGDNIFELADRNSGSETWPRVDITEGNDSYRIKADLPGLDKKDVKVTVDDGVLSLEGEKRDEAKREKDRYYHLERSYGRFCRSFTLPEGTDASRIEAKMVNGVLELTVPKSENARPKQIEVKVD